MDKDLEKKLEKIIDLLEDGGGYEPSNGGSGGSKGGRKSKKKDDESFWNDEIADNISNAHGFNKIGNILSGIDTLFQNMGKSIYQAKRSVREVSENVKEMIEPWTKADKAASEYAKTIAMTGEGMAKLRKQTIDNVVNQKIGINYNISTEDLIKAQESYAKTVGRNLRIDNTQQETLAAMTAVMKDGAVELATAFEHFGVNLNGAGEHASKMFAEASAEGLSFTKYSENVVKNIKIAQNYTFKNGLKGLESMAKKATALKLDMAQVASFANKVSTIEGSIDVASKLQVLGGSFASIADPLGMLSEGLMDMEGLTDRITTMIGGLGSFNKKTGEIEVSAFDKQRIKAAAEAMGMDYSQLMDSVTTKAKREEIDKQIKGSANARGLDEKMQELLKNSATFNEEGKAGVSINGQFKSIDELSNADYQDLVKETQDQAADIKDIARTLRSFDDINQGIEKQYDANKAQIAESMGIGDTVKGIYSTIGEMNGLLKIIAGTSMIGSLVQGISSIGQMVKSGVNMFTTPLKDVGGIFKGIFGKGAATGVESANMMGQITKITNYTSKGVETTTTKVIGNGLAGGAKGTGAMSKALNFTNAAKTSTMTQAAKVSNEIQNTVKATQAAKTAQMAKAAQAAKIAKMAKGTGIISGVISGVETGIDEFGTKKNYGTAKKVGRTAGSAIGGGLGAWGGAAAGAAIGSVVPVVGTVIGGLIGGAIGGLAGSSAGKWVGGGFANQKRRERFKNRLDLENVQGDYSVKKLKRIRKGLDTGEISDKLLGEIREKGDIELYNTLKKKRDERQQKEDGKTNIAKGTFTVKNAYFNGNFGTSPLGGLDFLNPISMIGKGIKAGADLISNITGKPEIGKAVDFIGKKENTENRNTNSKGTYDINISGTITLAGSNGESVDITNNLLSNPMFIRNLTDKIIEQTGNNNFGVRRQDVNAMGRM